MKKLQYNSPVILTFFLLSLGVLVLDWITGGWTTLHAFCVYRSSMADPLFYVRLFGHVLGHAGFDHFLGNMLLLLVIGPPLEALEQIPMEYRGRVSWISMEELEDGSWKKKLSGFHADFPVYFSVDKDVFSPQVCSTNWDQGTMRLEEMTGILGWFRSQGETTGVDLCGEPDPVRAKEREIARSMDVNRILMSFWLDKCSKEG